jgi:hypothetical protein
MAAIIILLTLRKGRSVGKRYVITKEVLEILHDADTDLSEVRRLLWSLPPIPSWATHFTDRYAEPRSEEIPDAVPKPEN